METGVAPQRVREALGMDTPPETSKTGFNPAQPRLPAGNPDSGQWSGSNEITAIPAAARNLAAARNPAAAAEYQTGDRAAFFDTLYPPVHRLARRLGIDETWLLGLAAYESGWLDPHDRDLNNPFGVTHGGGLNVGYAAIADAVAYWEKQYGSVVRGATSPQDFAQRLWEAGYNRKNSDWRKGVVRTIGSIAPHLQSWKSRRGGP
jgi:hypothetical protein